MDSIRWIPFDGFHSIANDVDGWMSMDAWVTARSGIDRIRMTSMDSIDREDIDGCRWMGWHGWVTAPCVRVARDRVSIECE